MPVPLTLVLTAAPGRGAITEALADKVATRLGLAPSACRWLSLGEAWEARTGNSHSAAREIGEAVREAVGPGIDVNLVQNEGEARRMRLLCADMESTIIAQELIDEMAGLIGCHAEVAAITAATMRGELDFAESLVRRVALFAGLEVKRLGPLLDGVTVMPGAETLVATMRTKGAKSALISGGFTLFAEPIAQRLGFDHVVANVLEIENGRLTGRVREPILGPRGKADALLRLAAEDGLAATQTLAVGDGANDAAMLAAAGLGVAFRAKPLLAAQAQAAANGAVVTHGDLTALLYLQGYDRVDFSG